MTDEHAEGDPDRPARDSVAEMKARLAEAEAAEADARADAAHARARAWEFPDAAEGGMPVITGYPVGRGSRPWMAQVVLLPLAALLAGIGLTLTVLMLWQHAKVSAQRDRDRRFVDAARDGVVALLSIDHTRAREDVQHVLDLTTGQFHDDFGHSADDFIKTAEASKAVTKGTVNVAALDRVDGDRARVLIAATSEVTNANGAQQDARPFRMNVTVTREGDTCKMSDVEFVP